MSQHLLEILNTIAIGLTMLTVIFLCVQLRYEVHLTRAERARMDQHKLRENMIRIIRQELRRAGYFDLKADDNVPGRVHEVMSGVQLIVICFCLTDEGFNASTFRARCFEDGPISGEASEQQQHTVRA